MAGRRTVVKVEGLRELDAALEALKPSTAKGVLRRVLFSVGQPIADSYAASVRRRSGALAESAGVGTKLTRRQAGLHRKAFRDDKASAEVFAGAGGLTQAVTEEFGTVHQPAQGDLRAAWDEHKGRLVPDIAGQLWMEIDATADRAARRSVARMRRAARTGLV